MSRSVLRQSRLFTGCTATLEIRLEPGHPPRVSRVHREVLEVVKLTPQERAGM